MDLEPGQLGAQLADTGARHILAVIPDNDKDNDDNDDNNDNDSDSQLYPLEVGAGHQVVQAAVSHQRAVVQLQDGQPDHDDNDDDDYDVDDNDEAIGHDDDITSPWRQARPPAA